MTKNNFARALAWMFALILTTASMTTADAQVASRVTQRVDESQLTTLPGHVRPFLQNATDRGAVSDDRQLGSIMLMFSRTPQQQQDLDALVDQMHNKNSEKYHKWLTPEEFGAKFEPSDEDVEAVKAWLESHGLTVQVVVPSKTHIEFTGTIGQLREAFHVDIHHVTVNGEDHVAAVNEPRIPSALAPVIAGLHQLDDFHGKPLFKNAGVFKTDKNGKTTLVEGTQAAPRAPDFTTTYNGSTSYNVGPQDFYTIYNENPLLNAGINGAGQTIAVIEEVQVAAADVNTFRSQFGLPAYPGTPNATQGGVNYIVGTSSGLSGYASCLSPVTQASGKSSGEESEADIDLQWAGAVAPNAIIDFVACGGTNGGDGSTPGAYGTDHAAQYIANYLYSTVSAASMSYGECEGDLTQTNMNYYNGQWEQFAAEGITAIISSGDGGAEQCYQNSKYATTLAPSANGFGDSAYNVSAGGTDFGDLYESNGYTTSPVTTWWSTTNGTGFSSALSYVPETTWAGYCSNNMFSSYLQKAGNSSFGTTYTPEAICNNTAANTNGLRAVVGGAGGISTFNSIPTWQSVYGVGLNSVSSTKRNVPDISLYASNGWWGHALPYCESDAYPCTYSNSTDAYDLGAGGTSFVAPQLAGLMALINQKSNDRQGQADYTIYNLAAQEYGTPGSPNSTQLTACSGSGQGAAVGSSCIFRDVSNDTPSLQGGTITVGIYQPCKGTGVDCYTGNGGGSYGVNVVPGTTVSSGILGYTASPGYDDATGLGSVNIYNLVENWNNTSPSLASTTVETSSSPTVAYSSNVTLTATVTATGRGGTVAPAGIVQFYEGSTSGTLLGQGSITSSCTGSGASLVCKGVAQLSVAGSSLTIGSNSIVAYFEGDGANDAPSTSAALSITSNNWPQTLTFSTPSSGIYGGSLALTASSTAGLTPTFQVVSGPATISGSTLSFTGVGSVVVEALQTGNSLYAAATPVMQTINVSPAPLSVTVNSASFTYGGSLPTFTGTASGLVNGDSLGTTVLVAFTSTVPATSNVGSYSGAITATLSGSSAANYSVTVTAGTLTITQAALTVTVNPGSFTYGGTPSGFTGSVTGLVNGDTSNAKGIARPAVVRRNVTGNDITVTYNLDATIVAATSNAGTYTNGITASVGGTASGNYTVTVVPATLTIAQAPLSVTVNPASFTYGGSLPAFTGSVTGLVNGDTSNAKGLARPAVTKRDNSGTSIVVTYSTSVLASSNVGDYSGAITASVGGTSAANYIVTVTPADLTILAAPLTVTVAPASFTYGGSLPTFTGSVTGLVNGDTSNSKGIARPATVRRNNTGTDIVVSYSTAVAASSPVGDYSGAITATVGGSAVGNYTVTVVPADLTITAAALTVTVAPASFTYGGSLPTFTGSVTGLVNGDSSNAKGIARPATVRRNDTGTDIVVTYSTAIAASSNVGTYASAITATVGGTAAGNYTVTVVPANLTITAASLTVTVNPASFTYGGSLPTFTGSVSGLVNGDTSNAKGIARPATVRRNTTSTDILVTYSTAIAASSNVGDYAGAITASVGGSAAGNYSVTVVPADLTITPAALTVTVNPDSFTYGGSPSSPYSGVVSGLVNGDTSNARGVARPAAVRRNDSGTDILVSYALDPTVVSATSGVGSYVNGITATVGGSAAGNYTVTVTPGTLTITQATLTVTVNPASFTYGGSLPTLSGTVSGLVNGDTSNAKGTTRPASVHRNSATNDIAVTYSTSVLASSGVGDYAGAITATVGGSAAGNYSITVVPADLTITAAPLTVTVNSASFTYGGSFPTFGGSVVGLVNGDSTNALGTVHAANVHRNSTGTGDVSVTYSSTVPVSSNAGTYAGAITAIVGGSAAGNYTVTVNPGTLTINQASQTLTFPVITTGTAATTINLVASATSHLAVTFASTTPSVCTVSGTTASLLTAGNCTIIASQAGNVDYTAAASASRTFTVVLATQTITFPNPGSQAYGSSFTLAATASSGLPITYTSSSTSVCTVSGSVVTEVGGGTCKLTATQAGNNTYAPATSVSESFSIIPANQTITLATIGAQKVGAVVALSATASSGLPVTLSASPVSVCTLSGTTLTLVGAGSCAVSASQAGNANYKPAATVTQNVAVTLNAQTITFTTSTPQTAGTTVTFTPTATSGLAVTLTSNSLSVCTLSGYTATLLAPGICSITATQPGNSKYAAATSVTSTFSVVQLAQTITFPAISPQTSGTTVSVAPTASSGLPVTVTSNSTTVCTVSGYTVSLLAPGNCSLTASQAGNTTYSAAKSVTNTFAVSQLAQTITFNTIATQNVGASFTLIATSTSNLPVSFSTTSASNVCTVTGSAGVYTATATGYGTCAITATQAGNTEYKAATPVTRSFSIVEVAQTITFPVPPAQVVGNTYQLQATASSGLAVSYTSESTTVCTVSSTGLATMVGKGTCKIQAAQAGNYEYKAASVVTVTFSVTAAP